MMTRAGSLAPLVRATSTSVNGGLLAPVQAVAISSPPTKPPAIPSTSTTHSMSLALPGGRMRGTAGPAVTSQVRFSHTDVRFPDFSDYRKPETTDPNKKNDTHESRNGYSYLITGGGAIATVYGAKVFVTDLVMYVSPPRNVLALGKIEVNLTSIPEGKSVTFKWRGKPLFIRHRTDTEIQREDAVSLSTLRDPETDSVRVKDPKWLVVIGVCTHLGCIPIADAGDFGGFYCPCHGSHYDGSGRIRKGPAPLNLEIPPYSFNDDKTELIVG